MNVVLDIPFAICNSFYIHFTKKKYSSSRYTQENELVDLIVSCGELDGVMKAKALPQ